MYYVSTSGDLAAICSKNKVIAFRLDKNEHKLLTLPDEPKQQGETRDKSSKKNGCVESSEDSSNCILCLSLSSCGKWLAICSASKRLIVWNTYDWSVISNRSMPRAASSLTFTPSGSYIVVADKSGDAYQFSSTNWSEEGTLLLGHLSMLLDVLISSDEKYVLTCDRDEKIRVSHFPNAYNIKSFCLGHEEFVTSIALLPHKPSILVSCSGDGTLRLWNFIDGLLCLTYSCSTEIIENLAQVEGKELNQIGGVVSIPLVKLSCFKLDTYTSVACVLPDGFKGCILYKIQSIESSSNNGNIRISLLQVLPHKSEICDASFTLAGKLLVLSAGVVNVLQAYSFDEDASIFTAEKCSQDLAQSLTEVNSYPNFFLSNPVGPGAVLQLFKRKYDNVQEYQERKKARTASNDKSGEI